MSVERGMIAVSQRSQAVAVLSLSFPVGIRFLKVPEGFIPLNAPRERFITMKEMRRTEGTG